MAVNFLADEFHRVNTLQVFHVNLNCENLERTVAFYELLGFRVVNEFNQTKQGVKEPSFAEIGLASILGLPRDCEGRAVLMALTDDPRSVRLDLIEWQHPKSKPATRTSLSQIGFGRLCMKNRDAWGMHRRLVDAGLNPYTEPTLITMGGTRQWVFCCEDPDGIVVEFMQFQRDDSPTTSST
jgi:glyoxylase I family protein